ncbi:primosomal protein N' [Halotalea alkalilenta]|uniref:primosomal protein N' n=1 Tax=Halotalea alkalilenta TaxID=376489 RepID=UPI0009DF6A5C|nr:primosomal protein N' [Halotalea alkalilenta]
MVEPRNTPSPHASPSVLRVALPTPLRRVFDYLPGRERPAAGWVPGLRVRVPFGRREMVGVVVEVAADSDFELAKLKPIAALIDQTPLPEEWLWLCRFTARYYQHSLGDTLAHAMPALLRQGRPLEARTRERWRCTPKGAALDPATLRQAKRQGELLGLLQQHTAGLVGSAVLAHGFARPQLEGLRAKGLVECEEEPLTRAVQPGTPTLAEPSLTLNREQGEALAALHEGLGRFSPSLLHGVTGSGKTEVYLQLIEAVLDRGGQALVLVPEIGLTPQTLERFRRRFSVPVVMIHSGVSDGERLDVWEAARSGRARVVVGTRSAIFTPMEKLGAIIVDEEHDASFKQQEGLRYSARDLAVVRARREQLPVVLGSATPSLESLAHAGRGHYRHLKLNRRAGSASFARLELVDLRIKRREGGLGQESIEAIKTQLDAGHQVLVFINRRGFAPTLSCQQCGHIFDCPSCDARMTLHRQPPRLVCHHCDHQAPLPDACPKCASGDLRPLGAGTERTEETLQARFPDARILRIDRDSTRRKDALSDALDEVRSARPCILVGTQMLAKGHHFPHVTLVVVVNADGGLYSSDFRALEQSAQLLVQVAGRAGRAALPGRVLIQTMHPDDPNLRLLASQGYDVLAERLLDERRAAGLPPFRFIALLRAEAADQASVEALLAQGAEQLRGWLIERELPVDCLGPVPAPMERRQNRYHAQLMLAADRRSQLHEAAAWLVAWLEGAPLARKVRWSIDIDPLSLS